MQKPFNPILCPNHRLKHRTHPITDQPHSVAPEIKKKPPEHSLLHNPSYCKMHSVIKELRPHFLEVNSGVASHLVKFWSLRSPNFWSCKASGEIRTKLKVLKELCKLMTTEIISQQNSTDVTGISKPGDYYNGEKLQDQPKQFKPGEYSETDRPFKRNGELKGHMSSVDQLLAGISSPIEARRQSIMV